MIHRLMAALLALGPGLLLAPQLAADEEIAVTVYSLTENGLGDSIGVIVVSDSPDGLVFKPFLRGLPPGPHGFHVHQGFSCGAGYHPSGVGVPGLAAGDHYDPDDRSRHRGPHGDGHRGDLPLLHANERGEAHEPVVAPRLGLHDVRGRTLVIHAGGDNYHDLPEPLGGGGARIACGSLELYKAEG